MLAKGNGEFRFYDMTDFSWDRLDIIVQPDDSYSESSVEKFVKDRGYKANSLQVLSLPRFLKREYESVFIFTKNNNLASVIRLDAREVRVKDTIYTFDPVMQTGTDYSAIAHNFRRAPEWIAAQTGAINEAKLTFIKKEEK